MKKKQKKLISYLQHENDWIEANSLANLLSVSTRTISSYVKEINFLYDSPLILSSYKGYRYNVDIPQNLKIESLEDDLPNRISTLIIKLITHSNLNFFDLADEMYISDSLLNMEIKNVSIELEKFDISIERCKNQLSLKGSEENKRKVMAYLLREESNAKLSKLLQGELFQSRFLSSDMITSELIKKINKILRSEENLTFNDFGIQNILIHILILIERIPGRYVLPKKTSSLSSQMTQEYHLAEEIKNLLEEMLQIKIPDAEQDYLTLIISSNSNFFNSKVINKDNIHNFVPKYYLTLSKKLIKELENNYFLAPFDSDFTVKFTLHVMNLILRSKHGIVLTNNFEEKTKETYPLIYDMALYIVKLLSKECNIQIHKTEVSFLVYHIGSFLLTQQSSNMLKSCIIYLNYNDLHEKTFLLLKEKYNNTVHFTMSSLSQFNEENYNSLDFIVTLGDLYINTEKPVLAFNILPTSNDFIKLDKAITSIVIDDRKQTLKNNLSIFIRKDLFDLDLYAKDEFKLIELLTNQCIALGLCDKDYQHSVIERELLSSTSIINGIAIPHSLEHNCKESFLYTVINSKGMMWGNKMVQMIILIGTSRSDTESFGEIFDALIKILYDPQSTQKLLKNTTSNSFVNTLVDLMLQQAYES